MRIRRMTVATASLALAASVLAGCGSSNDGGDKGGTAANKATGSPITIGYINEEKDPAASYPDIRQGADAAVQYINDQLGGVDNHPIKLDVCITQLSSGGARCAQQMVHDKVRAVTGGINLTSTQIWPVLKQAGIPYFGMYPVFSADSTSDGNHFYFGGGNQATFPGVAKFIGENAKRIDVLNADVSTDEIKALTEKHFTADGATVKYVPAPQGQADFSSYLVQIAKDKPDAVLVVFPTPDCVKIMQEASAVGLKAQMYYISQCAGVQTFATAGSSAVGARFILDTKSFTDTSDSQVAVFNKAMAAAGQSQNVDGFAQDGFSSVMNLYTLIKKAGGASSTAASIKKAALATSNESGFMGPNYSCSEPPIEGAEAVCGNGGRIGELQSDGKTLKDISGTWLTVN